MNIIETRDLVKKYGGHPAVDHVNMLSITDSLEYSAAGFNVIGFQFTYYESKFIQAGHKLSCMFKELKFTYTCN